MTIPEPAASVVPAIGSEWIARDGRRMRVDSLPMRQFSGGKPFVYLIVLSAQSVKFRKRTRMGIENFSTEWWSSFLSPASESAP